MNCRLLSLFLAVAGIFPATAGLYADESERVPDEPVAMEIITVTANKTEENPQDIPLSISTLGEVDITDRSIEQTADVFQRMPNMHLTQMGPVGTTENIVSIRGISSFMSGGSVFGFFVDDVYYPSSNINLLDVERIEVLRGPQGTLYGKNTEAGVINIITREPENDWGGNVSLSYGSYNTLKADFSTSGALVEDTLLLRLAGRFENSDGYFTNTVNNDDQINESENYDGRVALLFRPTERLTADLKVNLQHYDGNYAEFTTFDQVQDGDLDISVNDPGTSETDIANGSLKLAYDMENVRLTSITTASDNDATFANDVDFTAYDYMELESGTDKKLYTEELRLNSHTTSPLKWTVGAYTFTSEEGLSILYEMKPYGVLLEEYGDTDSTGVALFGQADYTIARFVFTAGLRYEYEEKDFDYEWKGGDLVGYTSCTGTAEENFDAVLPKFAVTYNLTDTFRPYASVSRGFKSGGFNLSAEPGKAYDSEYTWNYEVGIKSELLDNRLLLNAALFYIDWKDLQVEQPSYPDYIVDNAAEATSKGVEVEVTARPARGLEIYGSVGFVDASFDEYTLDGVDYSGRDVPNSPSSTYSLGATFRFLQHWMVNAEINGTGKIYYEADNEKSQDSYQIVDLKTGYESETFDVYFWAQNLFDEAYATRAFEMSGEWWARSGDPLTVGMTLRYRF